jgi:hypothetical protein
LNFSGNHHRALPILPNFHLPILITPLSGDVEETKRMPVVRERKPLSCVLVVCCAVLYGSFSTATAQELTRKERKKIVTGARNLSKAFNLAAETALPTVVKILNQAKQDRNDDSSILDIIGGDDRQVFDSVGSGVIVSEDGLVLTNHHVIKDAAKLEVRLNDGRKSWRLASGSWRSAVLSCSNLLLAPALSADRDAIIDYPTWFEDNSFKRTQRSTLATREDRSSIWMEESSESIRQLNRELAVFRALVLPSQSIGRAGSKKSCSSTAKCGEDTWA